MDPGDVEVIFQPNGLKLGERRLLEQQIRMLKRKECGNSLSVEREAEFAAHKVVSTTTKNSKVIGVTSTRKELTYPSCKVRSTVSPLQSYILQQKNMIEGQEKSVCTVKNERDNFMQERTPKQCFESILPTCGKCHLKEGHNRLNCPYPNACSSSTYCKNIDKHPKDKQTVKELDKKLSEERKLLSKMKEELKNRETSCASVSNRYVARIKDTLIASDPDKYIREIDGKYIEDWRLLNKDSKILEKHFKHKIPSAEEAKNTITAFDSRINIKRAGKTSVHNPYKKLWESQGVSWPKSHDNYRSSSSETSSRDCDEIDNTLRSPQRKKAAFAGPSCDDFNLALGMQNSFETLPNSFDLEAFETNIESDVDSDETQQNPPEQSDIAKNIEREAVESEAVEAQAPPMSPPIASVAENRGNYCLNLYTLAETALEELKMIDNDSY